MVVLDEEVWAMVSDWIYLLLALYEHRYRACKYSVVAWFSRARAANSSYKKLIIR